MSAKPADVELNVLKAVVDELEDRVDGLRTELDELRAFTLSVTQKALAADDSDD